MIPRTFPSIIEAFQTKMVVYVLPSITGLRAWIDYIPVKGVVTESATLANTYANGGYQVVKSLDSLTGLQAWIGYIPVYEDASYNKPWSTDAGGYIPVGGLFSIPSLFASGANGAWYDPSDYSTLFQDSAGTTPVTAVEQPVGLMLDKSQGLVLGSELVTNGDFSGGTTTGWVPSSATISVVGGQAELVSTVNGTFQVNQQIAVTAGRFYRFSATLRRGTCPQPVYVGFNGGGAVLTNNTTDTVLTATIAATASPQNLQIYTTGASIGQTLYFDNISVKELPGNHAFQATSASRPVLSARVNKLLATATLATQSVTTRATAHTLRFQGAGSVTLTGTAIGVYTAGTHSITTTAGTLTLTVLGSVTSADLRETNDGVGVPAYQAVVTSTNYATTGFLPYLRFDGVDDSLSTNSISFTSTDKMSVFAGVRKLSDAALGMLLETSAISDSNDGTIFVLAPGTVGTHSYAFRSKGTVSQNAQSGLIATAPITNTLTGLGNISGDLATLRLNGAQVAQNTGDQGTGNYGNYPLYIGRRNNASLPFNGQMYSMIIVGKAVTAGELSSTETYVNQKTGAY